MLKIKFVWVCNEENVKYKLFFRDLKELMEVDNEWNAKVLKLGFRENV